MGVGGSTQNLPDSQRASNTNVEPKNQLIQRKFFKSPADSSSTRNAAVNKAGLQKKDQGMGANSVKGTKLQKQSSPTKQGAMASNDVRSQDHVSQLLEKLQLELAEKDRKITELGKQMKDTGNRYQNASKPDSRMLESLKDQLENAQHRLSEKDDVIKSLQRQLNMSRSERETQVAIVKETVEQVIREKEGEIRRMRAMWNESVNANIPPISDEDFSNDLISRATKYLTVQELTPENKNARFGISAEDRISKTTPVEVVPKSKDEVLQIRKALKANVFLKGLDAKQVTQLIDCMTKESLKKGKNAITEGELGDRLFVLDSGRVEVFHSRGIKHIHVADLEPGTVFGELAILYNCKRTASVKAKTDVTLWSLDRKHFQAIVKQSGEEKREGYVRLLKTVDKLKALSDNKIMRIADCVEEASFKRDDYIIRQGEVGDSFYVIQDGQVKVTKNKESNKHADREEELLCYLKTGEYFGERALLTEDNRAANVIAASDMVNVLMLDRLAFNSLLGSLSEVTSTPSQHAIPLTVASSGTEVDAPQPADATVLPEQDITDMLEGRFTITSKAGRETEAVIKKTTLEQLKVLAILGQGGFGCVKLVRVSAAPCYPLALKSIRKAKIIKTGQQQHVLAERNIMMAMDTPFIGRLFRTFKDDLRIYMLMEAYLGGEVYGYLKRHGPMEDKSARFCAACVLEALSYLHERAIVYRDLKPENLMLSHRGYVKLVDFGFAKKIKIGFKTWTFCGTPEYFPPEILSNTGHDIAADYWSYGILVYELLTRTTPFFAADDMTVYENILGGIEGVKFSRRVGRNAELLIRSLCKLEPRDRLGYQKGGPNNIRKHRWFQTFDWQGLRATRIPSPIKPTVSGLTDTKNFDHCVEELGDPEEDKKVIAKAVPGWDAMF